jgi:hypothetical protein
MIILLNLFTPLFPAPSRRRKGIPPLAAGRCRRSIERKHSRSGTVVIETSREIFYKRPIRKLQKNRFLSVCGSAAHTQKANIYPIFG